MRLDDIWKEIDSCECSHLQHILGAGARNPDLMIVFINPTQRNISSNPNWKGPRFPFIGRKRPWDIFERVGWIDVNLWEEIKKRENNWSYDFTDNIRNYLVENKLYLTNVIKCTGEDATLPKISDIKSQLHLFEKEIKAVNPKIIVSFGLLPTKALLKEDVKMSELYEKLIKEGPHFFNIKIDKIYKVFPCYYPIGRGNPKRAVEMLKYLNSYIKSTL